VIQLRKFHKKGLAVEKPAHVRMKSYGIPPIRFLINNHLSFCLDFVQSIGQYFLISCLSSHSDMTNMGCMLNAHNVLNQGRIRPIRSGKSC
jgi:hypothetical protein